jgi:2-polyprenyl-3-methyl-5-hydroxy-6-metoxy-1,4-benzoquinol methylase
MIQYFKFQSPWLQFLIILSIILIVLYFSKKKQFNEGFEQSLPFILKQENEIYDDFYCEIYDYLQKSSSRIEFETIQIIEMTQPSKNNSVLLDIGSGTGYLVNSLNELGYKTFGIDKSSAMIEYSKQKFPKHQHRFSINNAMDTMIYERNVFTHILCMNFTIYHFQDKSAFFKHCYFWLIPNGYLVIHLVNRNTYNPIVPSGMPSSRLLENPQQYSKSRITDTEIDFQDFQYKHTCNFDKENQVIIHEKFTDSATKHIRQNELTLYMEKTDDILKIARECNFLPISQIQMKDDKHQSIYILEKV